MSDRKLLSVCIPTYEMYGKGHIFLRQSLDVLEKQSFKDFDVVISDHSQEDTIEKLCGEYEGKLDIQYYRNTNGVGSSSANINYAIQKATGMLIKILFQDDFLYSNTALEDIVENFNIHEDYWLLTASEHSEDGVTHVRPFYPIYTDRIAFGENTISSPSVLTIKNEHPLLFDEKLLWRMDTDYYKRCYDAFGLPKIIPRIGVVNRIGAHQISSTKISRLLRLTESTYLEHKYHGNSLRYFMLAIALWTLKVAQKIRKRLRHPKMTMTRSEIINRLIQQHGYQSYLEIGVNTPAQPGWVFDSVQVAIKHGVDPEKKVNATFPMTSDEFFAKHIGMKYDIIFVDGLHLSEQAYRDIVNSLKWLNDNGTIVVHDCNPVEEITQRRERASDAWHGDVWKAILKLRMEEPHLSIYTVDTDEGCAIIQKGTQKLFSAGASTDMSTFSFFDTYRKEILNLISVEKFKKRIAFKEATVTHPI